MSNLFMHNIKFKEVEYTKEHRSAKHFRMVEGKVVPHWLLRGSMPFVYYTESADWFV